MSTALPRGYDAAAVVIPAHNERAELPACLRAVLTAALCAPIPVTVVVVLDGCDDGSDELAERFEAAGHHIHRDTDLSVITSKRIPARDPYGFADYLTQLGRTAAGDCA